MGYDMSHAVWHNAGWQEMKDLRKKLENLKELRDLIKKLGRASGKGPKRRAPQEARPHSPHQLAALHLLPQQWHTRHARRDASRALESPLRWQRRAPLDSQGCDACRSRRCLTVEVSSGNLCQSHRALTHAGRGAVCQAGRHQVVPAAGGDGRADALGRPLQDAALRGTPARGRLAQRQR